jgi:hypothetical protein
MDVILKYTIIDINNVNNNCNIEDNKGNKKKLQWISSGMTNYNTYNTIINIQNIDNYPKTTDILCFNCTLKCYNVPIGLPYKTVMNSNIKVFYVKKCFCSFSCAKKYNIDTYIGEIFTRQEVLLNHYYICCGGKLPIKCAPNRENLMIFGGSLTDEKYKEKLDFLSEDNYEKLPPTISLNLK